MNSVDNRGNTPLHICIIANNTIGVKILLEAGACIEKENKDFVAPFHLAKSSENKEIKQLFFRIRKVLVEAMF